MTLYYYFVPAMYKKPTSTTFMHHHWSPEAYTKPSTHLARSENPWSPTAYHRPAVLLQQSQGHNHCHSKEECCAPFGTSFDLFRNALSGADSSLVVSKDQALRCLAYHFRDHENEIQTVHDVTDTKKGNLQQQIAEAAEKKSELDLYKLQVGELSSDVEKEEIHVEELSSKRKANIEELEKAKDSAEENMKRLKESLIAATRDFDEKNKQYEDFVKSSSLKAHYDGLKTMRSDLKEARRLYMDADKHFKIHQKTIQDSKNELDQMSKANACNNISDMRKLLSMEDNTTLHCIAKMAADHSSELQSIVYEINTPAPEKRFSAETPSEEPPKEMIETIQREAASEGYPVSDTFPDDDFAPPASDTFPGGDDDFAPPASDTFPGGDDNFAPPASGDNFPPISDETLNEIRTNLTPDAREELMNYMR